MTMISPGSGHRAKRPWWATAIVVLLFAVVLFVAGFGVAWFLRGGSPLGGGSSAEPSPEPLPCETVTVVPGNGLPRPGQVTTNVYNATDRVGLAAETAAELKRRGFGIATIANDPLGKRVRKPAEIRHGAQGADAALLMSFYIPGSVLVPDDRTDATIDTVLGQRFDGLASPGQVQKALTAPSPSPSGPGCAATPPTGAASPSPTSASPAPTPSASAT